MKIHKIIELPSKNGFFGNKLKTKETEELLNEQTKNGWEIVSIFASDVAGQGAVGNFSALLVKDASDSSNPTQK
jgi:hypothetical protein